MKFEIETILGEFDAARSNRPGCFFPAQDVDTILYHFLLDLEHGYCSTANSRVHVYSNQTDWAIVFEKLGYFNRAGATEIELVYFGNCIEYPQQTYEGRPPSYIDRTYISNAKSISIISGQQFENASKGYGFETLPDDCKSIEVRSETIEIPTDLSVFEEAGVTISEKLEEPGVGYEELTRYLAESKSDLVLATDDEIRQHITESIPRILVLDDFAYVSVYDDEITPSDHETFQLLSKVADKADATLWTPTTPSNNHWSNWESGNL